MYYSLHGGGSPSLTFLPSYAYMGGWHPSVYVYSKILAFICLLYWVVPFANARARAVSFGFFLCHYYLSFIAANLSPWYIANTSMLAIFILANAAHDLVNSFQKVKNAKIRTLLISFLKCLIVFVVFFNALIFACVAYQLRIQQRVIEDGNRKQIGLWLNKNALQV